MAGLCNWLMMARDPRLCLAFDTLYEPAGPLV
jgi:hypothetical protein